MTKEQEKEIFITKVYEYEDEFPQEMLEEFCFYWTEWLPRKQMMRFQNNWKFDYHQRLLSWKRKGQPGKSKAQLKEMTEFRRERFREQVYAFEVQYPREMLDDFFLYWGETNEEGTQMRWQKQPTFNLRMRLQTWARKEKKYGNKNYRKPLNREERLQEEARIRQQQYQEGFDILTGRSPQLPPDGGSAAQLSDLRELPPSV